MQTFLLAYDHPILRKGIRNILENTGKYKIIAEFNNGNALIDFIISKNQFPDFVLLDLKIPILNGYETSEILLKKYPTIKIIIF
jgi:DNA-binding NarL/FixJ family response regulator